MKQDSKDKSKWYADEGKIFRRISDHNVVGNLLVLGVVNYINGVKLYLPKLEVITDYEEIDETTLEKEKEEVEKCRQQKYEACIEAKIRARYSLSEELAIQRQRDSKPEEFKEYYEYCEKCKNEAKEIYEGKLE